MPRKAQTQTGQKAQAPASIPGQMYGAIPAQVQLQQAMPAPDVRASAPGATSPAPVQQGAAVPAAPPPAQPPADPMQIARDMQLNGGLLAATQRPQEPVTAGLSTGPGPGPEVLYGMPRQSPVGETLRMLSNATGDTMFENLARLAGL